MQTLSFGGREVALAKTSLISNNNQSGNGQQRLNNNIGDITSLGNPKGIKWSRATLHLMMLRLHKLKKTWEMEMTIKWHNTVMVSNSCNIDNNHYHHCSCFCWSIINVYIYIFTQKFKKNSRLDSITNSEGTIIFNNNKNNNNWIRDTIIVITILMATMNQA